MEHYQNLGGNSGVSAFEIAEGMITVQFSDGAIYIYTDESSGPHNIEQMQALAIRGQGLNSFINRYVRDAYASKQ